MGLDALARLDEAGGSLGELQAQQGGPGGQHEIEAAGHEVLVAAVELAQAALGAVAVDGIADRDAGSDNTHAGGAGRFPGGTNPPSELKGPAVHAAALFADGAKINRAL